MKKWPETAKSSQFSASVTQLLGKAAEMGKKKILTDIVILMQTLYSRILKEKIPAHGIILFNSFNKFRIGNKYLIECRFPILYSFLFALKQR